MRGLLPRSLPSPIPYNSDQSSGFICWSFCGVRRRLSSGRLRCSSKISLVKPGCCRGLWIGDCTPLGAGVCVPICTGVSNCASLGGSSSLHPFCPGVPPHHAGPGSCPRFLLAAAASIMSTNMALSCIAPRPARSSPKRSPTSRLVNPAGPSNSTIWAHACWTCA